MQEEFGAIFGYNYRRRILINIRNRKKRLREKHLLMVRNKELAKERKKREAIAISNFFKKEEEKKNIILIPEYEEVSIDNKLALADILKEGLVLLLQELRLIKGIEVHRGIKDSISTDDLIKQIQEDINNLSFIKGDNLITPEEEGIILDILNDNTIEGIIEEKKKMIARLLDRKKFTNWIEFDEEVKLYDEFIKENVDELKEIDNKLDSGLLKEEEVKEVIDEGFNKSYKVLKALAISTKKENPIDRIVSINMGLSLMRDIVSPKIQVKDYNVYSINNYTKEIERCYMDPSYCRLSVIDSKRSVYEISKELKKKRNSNEYNSIYQKLIFIVKELDREEFDLIKMIRGKEKENNKVYIKEMEDYE